MFLTVTGSYVPARRWIELGSLFLTFIDFTFHFQTSINLSILNGSFLIIYSSCLIGLCVAGFKLTSLGVKRGLKECCFLLRSSVLILCFKWILNQLMQHFIHIFGIIERPLHPPLHIFIHFLWVFTIKFIHTLYFELIDI